MALFKIEKGLAASLATARPTTHEGWCYFTTNEGKFYIDIADGDDLSARVCLNAAKADKLTVSAGDANTPVYFKDGVPVACTSLGLNTTGSSASCTGNAASANKLTISAGNSTTPVYFKDGRPVACDNLNLSGDYLPLTAGADYKLTGALGLTQNVMYGTNTPVDGFEGQLYFIEDDSLYLPDGGAKGQALVKNSSVNGDASWKDIVALPSGGSTGQALIKNSSANADASWQDIVALPTGGNANQILVKNSSTDGDASWKSFYATSSTPGLVSTAAQTFNGAKTFTSDLKVACTPGIGQIIAKNTNYSLIIRNDDSSSYFLLTNSGDADGRWNDLRPLTINNGTGVVTCGTQLFGAVWNDYAEYRSQEDSIEPGYCVFSTDNGLVHKTTEKFQACDGIVSDTFGFAIGETDNCKTPLAVAGRVLVYCEGDRNDYHSGDTVCAGPDGKVCKMTREEIREWPDRIVGIVSEIPNYDTWGTGNIKVNNRIWIKVK